MKFNNCFSQAIVFLGIVTAIVASINSCAADDQGMKIHLYFEEFFCKNYGENTYKEYDLYLALKKKPLKSSVNYLAVPWVSLWIAGKLPEAINELRKLGLHFDGGFTACCYLIHPLDTELLSFLNEIGIDCIFTECATMSETYQTYGRSYANVRIEPFPYRVLCEIDLAPIKDILYSFIGYATHPVRQRLFSIKSLYQPNTIIKERPQFIYLPGREEYMDVLARSRFALCPRGHEPHSIRFYEALQVGAIPILIANDVRLPDGFDWDRCVIRVKENNMSKIPAIVSMISSEQEAAMRCACLEAYAAFSGENFTSVIERYYGLRD